MITLTVIVLAIGLGWGFIKLWNGMAYTPPERPAAAPETLEQVPGR
jgi:hypothetical protein